MSELDRIKQAMTDGEHTDGDLEWCVDEIERLMELQHVTELAVAVAEGAHQEAEAENDRLTAENGLLILQAAHAENDGYDAAIAKIGQENERLQARVEALENVLRDFPTIAKSRAALIKRIKDWLPSRRKALAATEQEDKT